MTVVIWKDKLLQLLCKLSSGAFVLTITSDVLHSCVFEPLKAPLINNIEGSLQFFRFFSQLLDLL
jgi:hypothetical protein